MTSIRSFVKKIIGGKKFITIVSGLPRSGTSMMMSALEAGGMDLLTDGLRRADINNPKGYNEFENVKKLAKGETDWIESAEGKVIKVISALLNFLPENYQYRVIFMERDIDEIMASQQRMLKRSGINAQSSTSENEIRKSYVQHIGEVKTWLTDSEWIRAIFVSYNDILHNPERNFREVARFLDNLVDPDAMAKVVDYSLYREKN